MTISTGASLDRPSVGNAAAAQIDTDALIDLILSRYHEVHRRELTELVQLARKVETVHATHPRAPHGLAELLQHMRGALEIHMKKEELILFPAMRRGLGAVVGAPIMQMRLDHDEHDEQLRQLKSLTNGFLPPAEACGSWRALFAGVAKLSEDLTDHIHLENDVLFPRFQEAPAP